MHILCRFLVDEVPISGDVTVHEACTLIFSSPRDDRVFQRFLNEPHATKKFMSVWKETEITRCWELLYAVNDGASSPDMSLDAVMERFTKWGGIPRYVLEKTGPDHQQRLQEAISGANLSSLARSVGDVSTNQQSLRILHIVRNTNFDKDYITFASKYVSDEVFNTQFARSKLEVELFISATKGSPELASVRGIIFERFAHVLIAGQKRRPLRARYLGIDGGETDIAWPEMERRSFASAQSLAELLAEAGAGATLYLKPTVINFPAIDAIVPGQALLQMTVSLRHGLRSGAAFQSFWDGVLAIGSKERGDNAMTTFSAATLIPAIYFVVPEDIYHEFKAQKVTGSVFLESLAQYALCVPTATQTGHVSASSSTSSSPPRLMEIDSRQ